MSALGHARLDGRIKLRHLVCFAEVSLQKSAIKAASALGLSQPAVSKTIHELEDNLGVPLFEPNRRSMILTPAGELFLRYAGSSLIALKQGLKVVSQSNAAGQSVLTIGALPTASARILPAAIEELSRHYPNLRVRVVTGSNDVLIAQLRLGDIDLVVGRMAGAETMKGLAFEYLYSERIVLAARPGHPLVTRGRHGVSEIGAYQLLIPPPGSVIFPVVQRYFIAHSIQPTAGEIETVSDAFARNYLLRTDAIWAISEGVVAEDVAGGTLATLDIDTEDTAGPVGLTTRTDLEPPFPAPLFVAALRNVLNNRLNGPSSDRSTGRVDPASMSGL